MTISRLFTEYHILSPDNQPGSNAGISSCTSDLLGRAVLVSLVTFEYTYNTACTVSAMAQCDQPPVIAVDPTDACDDVTPLAADARNECSDDTPIINEMLCFVQFYLKRAPKTKIIDVAKRHFSPDEVVLAKECLCTTFGDNIARKLKNRRNTVNKMKS